MVKFIKKNKIEAPRILYIAYWGALEQLGQSLIVPAVKKLAQMGAELTLVTFEKPTDLTQLDEMNRVREMLAEDKIEWIPLQYHKSPKIPATVFDIVNGIGRGIQKRAGKRFDIVHARTYIGGLIGLTLAPLIGAKFVYHNEGFYPDEQVDGGVWIKDSRPHKIAKWLENFIYSRADGIIALSFRAKAIIEDLPTISCKKTPVIFVPSCVDLEHFKLSEKKQPIENSYLTFVYVGNFDGRYAIENIGRFMSVAKREIPNVKLQIYSKAVPSLINKRLSEGGLSEQDWQLESVPYTEMPKHLAKCDIGIHFLRKGISEHSGSPTKIGEYWAVGLPVIVTPNMGDVDVIVKDEEVGVVVEEYTENSYQKAIEELKKLLGDCNLKQKCRNAAEEHYALVPACERQIALYKNLVEN